MVPKVSAERRRESRLRLGLDCWVRHGYPAETYARSRLFDLSVGGAALFVEGPVPSRLAIALRLESGRYLHLTARVRWNKVCNDQILLGISFEESETLPEVGRWLSYQVGHRRAGRGLAA